MNGGWAIASGDTRHCFRNPPSPESVMAVAECPPKDHGILFGSSPGFSDKTGILTRSKDIFDTRYRTHDSPTSHQHPIPVCLSRHSTDGTIPLIFGKRGCLSRWFCNVDPPGNARVVSPRFQANDGCNVRNQFCCWSGCFAVPRRGNRPLRPIRLSSPRLPCHLHHSLSPFWVSPPARAMADGRYVCAAAVAAVLVSSLGKKH